MSTAGPAPEPESKVKSPTFHNTRWPLLTALLEEKGWRRAAVGEVADLAFVDDGAWQKEKDSKLQGRMKFFSRIYTDILANKRSCAVGMLANGLVPDLMTPTFVTFKEWEVAMNAKESAGEGSQLWFFKKKNSNNSNGIAVTASLAGGRQILALDAAAPTKEGKAVLEKTFDDDFMLRMHEHLKAQSAELPVDDLRRAFSQALCSSAAKIEQTMMNWIVQQGVERPLLISGGRKFCLRIYVVALVRPGPPGQASPDDLPVAGPRELEAYVSSLEIARPQKAAFDPASTDGASQFEDSSTLYASASDGSCYAVERWQKQWSQIKETVRRVLTSFNLVDAEKHIASAEYQSHFAWSVARKSNPVPAAPRADEGRLNIMGWDFMMDEDDKAWLIEINTICNLQHSMNSKLDMFNKTALAEALYDLALAPMACGVAPKQSEHLHRVI